MHGPVSDYTGNAGPTWYQDAYFRAFVADELERCRENDRSSFLVYLRLVGCSRTAARLLFNCVRDEVDESDFAGMLANGDYAICLRDCGLRMACELAQNIERRLAGFDASVGVAGLGIDGMTPQQVLDVACRDTWMHTDLPLVSCAILQAA